MQEQNRKPFYKKALRLLGGLFVFLSCIGLSLASILAGLFLAKEHLLAELRVAIEQSEVKKAKVFLTQLTTTDNLWQTFTIAHLRFNGHNRGNRFYEDDHYISAVFNSSFEADLSNPRTAAIYARALQVFNNESSNRLAKLIKEISSLNAKLHEEITTQERLNERILDLEEDAISFAANFGELFEITTKLQVPINFYNDGLFSGMPIIEELAISPLHLDELPALIEKKGGKVLLTEAEDREIFSLQLSDSFTLGREIGAELQQSYQQRNELTKSIKADKKTIHESRIRLARLAWHILRSRFERV